MDDTVPVTKTTQSGHVCWIVLAVTSAILLIPYMILKHGPLHLDSNLVGQTLTVVQNVSPVVSIRHLQALRPVKLTYKHPPTKRLRSPVEAASILPSSVMSALNYKTNRSGYLIGNISHLELKEYDNDVDLRIIVPAYNRASSLLKCLTSLNSVEFGESSVSVHVWIDRNNQTGTVDKSTYNTAQQFKFTHGGYHVHIQPTHVGILSQWVNVWRPCKGTREVALILEDDMTVSKHFWHWLRPVHKAYNNRTDVSGYGLSHPGMEHMHATYLDIPARFAIYMYKVICTWGFSPHATSWRHFQAWFYHSETNSSFLPLVPRILPSQWLLGELRRGQERNLWEMWHICYSHYSHPPQYTVMLNTAQEGLLAVNRHEAGLHDRGTAKSDPLCEVWKDVYGLLPQVLPKFGYDGRLENAAEVEEEEVEEGIGYDMGDVSYWKGR